MKKRKAPVKKDNKYQEKIKVDGTFDDFFNALKNERQKKIEKLLSKNEKKA